MQYNKVKPGDYFNIAQYRSVLWHDLKEACTQISRNRNVETNCNRYEDVVSSLRLIEKYWAFPGLEHFEVLQKMYARKEYTALLNVVNDTVINIASEAYRSDPALLSSPSKVSDDKLEDKDEEYKGKTNYYEILIVDNLDPKDRTDLQTGLLSSAGLDQNFTHKTLHASTVEDALNAISFNPNIQACVIRYDIPFQSEDDLSDLSAFTRTIPNMNPDDFSEDELSILLGNRIKVIRPELDLYLVTDAVISDIDDSQMECFNRIFFRMEDVQELQLCIQRDIKSRYNTPFFSALKDFSQKPTGVFHAMPISRGNSVFKSRWIKDFGDFYGRNLFLAETSATTGGLDSLLQPTGPLKQAQAQASKAYGSMHTFFATNGTSTANKIVLQALVKPGDLVLIDRDCHKSHHYGLVLSGAFPVYLDSYPMQEYSMYGAVPLEHIKSKLLLLKEAGRLDKVKMLLLTNCTFDGIVYNVEKVMQEVLAIKPDIIFLWDEAWFAFAGFTHTYKRRTAMYAASKLHKRYRSDVYRLKYDIAKASNTGESLPDPDKVKVRVYATQSTHKTLSALRQGSMIHIYDEDFQKKSKDPFMEAYMTHTSTSPNYQILASLDISRRQVQFEGFELVEKSIEMAMVLRSKIMSDPLLKKYFDVLTVKNFIPAEYRTSGIEEYFNPVSGWSRMNEAWVSDEFVLDPTKINLYVGKTGVDGDTFKNKYLMDQYSIQVNKTSRNTVLFMTNIGTKRSSVSYLLTVLLKIAKDLEKNVESLNEAELELHKQKIHSLTMETPPLPDFSNFHASFQAVQGVPGGNLRAAYFLSYDETKCRYIQLDKCAELIKAGEEIVSASFVIPYPPGFPILVPGQVLSKEILEFFIKLDVKEVHGFQRELGLRAFKTEAIDQQHMFNTLGRKGKMTSSADINIKSS